MQTQTTAPTAPSAQPRAYSVTIYSRWDPVTRKVCHIRNARIDRIARVHAASASEAMRRVRVGAFESVGIIAHQNEE